VTRLDSCLSSKAVGSLSRSIARKDRCMAANSSYRSNRRWSLSILCRSFVTEKEIRTRASHTVTVFFNAHELEQRRRQSKAWNKAEKGSLHHRERPLPRPWAKGQHEFQFTPHRIMMLYARHSNLMNPKPQWIQIKRLRANWYILTEPSAIPSLTCYSR
jgi:hypothetical protein